MLLAAEVPREQFGDRLGLGVGRLVLGDAVVVAVAEDDQVPKSRRAASRSARACKMALVTGDSFHGRSPLDQADEVVDLLALAGPGSAVPEGGERCPRRGRRCCAARPPGRKSTG